jgi:hypothetical protein
MSRQVTPRVTRIPLPALAVGGALAPMPAAPPALAAVPEVVYIDPVGPQVAVGTSLTLTAYRCPFPASGHGFGDDLLPDTADDRCRRTKAAWTIQPKRAGTLSARGGASTVFRPARTGRVTITATTDESRSSTVFDVRAAGPDQPLDTGTEMLGLTADGLVVFTLPTPGEVALASIGGPMIAEGPAIPTHPMGLPDLPGEDTLIGADYDPLTHQVIGVGASGAVYAFMPGATGAGGAPTIVATLPAPLSDRPIGIDVDTRTNHVQIVDGTATGVDLASGTGLPGPDLGFVPWDPNAGVTPALAGLLSSPATDGGTSGLVAFDTVTGMFAGLDPESGQLVSLSPFSLWVPGSLISMDTGPDGTMYVTMTGPTSQNTVIHAVDPFSGTDTLVGMVDQQLLGMTVLSYLPSTIGPTPGDKACQTQGLVGDFNGDDVVDTLDQTIWSTGDPIADVNRDGVVDQLDLDAWKRNFGRRCP